MTVQRQIDQLIVHRASEWLEILNTGGPAEREAFVDWLRESRRHMSEFLAIVALDCELNKSTFQDLLDREVLFKRISPYVTGLQSNPEIRSARDAHRAAGYLVKRHWRVALAAGLAAIALAVAIVRNNFWLGQSFVTASGEQRAIELSDGSVVLLNVGSRVHAHLNASARDLELLSGEALFKVARDPRRPFRVRTRNAVVQAVGTQFNVKARQSGTLVSVLEGKVQISTQEGRTDQSTGPKSQVALVAGEVAHIEVNGKINHQAQVSATEAAAWRQRRLVFHATSIGEVVRAFNQHNAAPKLRLQGISGSSRHYSAIFDADDPASFVDFLNREQDLAVERLGDEFVIRRR